MCVVCSVHRRQSTISCTIPTVCNINLSYRLLELLKYRLLSSNASRPARETNTVKCRCLQCVTRRVVNQLGQEVELRVGELTSFTVQNESQRHIINNQFVTLSHGNSFVHSLSSAAVQLVVSVTKLKGIGEDECYASEVAVVVDRNSACFVRSSRVETVVVPVRSSQNSQFLLASITTSPPEIVLYSGIQLRNDTSFPLQFSFLRDNKTHDSLIGPFSTEHLPFCFSLAPFSFRLKPPSYDSSSSFESSSFVSFQTTPISCPPLSESSALGITNEWICTCTRTPQLLSKNDAAVHKQWKSRFPELQSKVYSFRLAPLFTVILDPSPQL